MNCGIIRRMRLTIINFSLFFNLCPFYLFAQTTNLRSRTLTVSNRLSNLEVTSILQDKKGFIWIGTNSGLNRYDGYFVKNIPFLQQISVCMRLEKIICLPESHLKLHRLLGQCLILNKILKKGFG